MTLRLEEAPAIATAQSSTHHFINYLTHIDLLKALDKSATEQIEAELEWIYLESEEAFAPDFEETTADGYLYVLVRGRLGVMTPHADGQLIRERDLAPGVMLDEATVFTQQKHPKRLWALELTELVKFSRATSTALAQRCADVMARFSERMQPRLQQVQLTQAFNRVFGSLGPLALEQLEEKLEWRRLHHGDILIRQGATDDGLYIVISGRFNVALEEPDGQMRVVDTVSRGECVGELAFLTGKPRSATVYAIRDTVVVRLPRAAFDQLVGQCPQIMGELTPHVVERVHQSNNRHIPSIRQPATTAIIALGDHPLLTKFVRQLMNVLNCFGSTLHLRSDDFLGHLGQRERAQISKDHPASLVLESWLSEQETKHRYLFYEADSKWTPWTQRCLRNADRILLLGWAEDDPGLSLIEQEMIYLAASVPQELVLLHPRRTIRPTATKRWLSQRQVQSHHHVRFNHVEDLHSLARRLTGNAVGLVLSGGVARSFAHIGVLRAIREANIPIDMIGGTSLGSAVAAGYALGYDYETMVEGAKSFFSTRKIFDFTLPLVSIATSRKMSNTLATEFKDIEIEDLWLPYFCVSSNLSRARLEIHRNGPLWRYLRASCSLPGVFTPLVENGDLLVDGGVINNLPVDVMKTSCQGMIIAVDVSAETNLGQSYDFNSSLSGWHVLWSRLNPFTPEIKAPSLVDTVMRTLDLNGIQQRKANQALADLYITPPVGHYGARAFGDYQALIDLGYRSAQVAIEGWLNQQVAAWGEKYG